MDRHLDISVLLTDIGARVEWPEPPTAFAARVVGKLEGQPMRRPLLRRFVPVAGALASLVAMLLVFSPGTRDAVADFFGIGGVRIERVAPRNVPTPAIGGTFDFGDRVSLDEAKARLGYDVLVPALPVLGEPDEVYLSPRRPPGGLVALVYGARPGFEPDPVTDVSILITQFQARLETRGGFFKKLAGPATTIRQVEVNGNEGYWLSGGAHSFFYRDSDGNVVQESLRLVANVLLWEQDGLTLRIETIGSLRSAQDVARSLR